MKLGFDGNVFTPNLTYLFLWATDRNSGNLVLEEAWAKYAFRNGAFKNFFVKGGQFKDPFAHESLTSSKKLLAAERTLLNDIFTGGDNFVQGASMGWDDGPEGSPFRAEVAFTDGANAVNQNFQDFPTTNADFGSRDSTPSPTTRVGTVEKMKSRRGASSGNSSRTCGVAPATKACARCSALRAAMWVCAPSATR